MVNKGVVVNMLLFVGNNSATEVTFAAFSVKQKVCSISRNSIVKSDNIVIYSAVCLLFYKYIADSYILGMSFFKAIKVKCGIVSYKCFNYLCG